MIMNSVAKSEMSTALAEEIYEHFGIAERHATLIARDQLSKYYGAVNKSRQENLGVGKFIWRTMNDERVRDAHSELEGREFSWNDLPVNDRGEEIYPGSEIQCRCSAEPVLDDLLDDIDEAEGELNTTNLEGFEGLLEQD
jgi:SPP1 gp7 family putative phage head morphogenesis protein